MAGGGNGKSKASNLTRVRKRVEADSSPSSASNASSNSLKRAKNGSAFTKWFVLFKIDFLLGFGVLMFFQYIYVVSCMRLCVYFQ